MERCRFEEERSNHKLINRNHKHKEDIGLISEVSQETQQGFQLRPYISTVWNPCALHCLAQPILHGSILANRPPSQVTSWKRSELDEKLRKEDRAERSGVRTPRGRTGAGRGRTKAARHEKPRESTAILPYSPSVRLASTALRKTTELSCRSLGCRRCLCEPPT